MEGGHAGAAIPAAAAAFLCASPTAAERGGGKIVMGMGVLRLGEAQVLRNAD